MPLANLSELRSAIADFMNRSDMTTAQADVFVSLVESDLKNDVRVRAMESTTAITFTGQTMPAPANLLEARNFSIGGWYYQFAEPAAYNANRLLGTVSRIYTQIGQNFVVNNGTGTAVGSLTYIGSFDPLTAGTNTNWLLLNAPDCYLYGACSHAAQFYMDQTNLERFKALYLGAVNRLNQREQSARYTGPLLIYPTTSE